ncbi:unnamed protein product [Ectocarpus sp. 6 AP-2014]
MQGMRSESGDGGAREGVPKQQSEQQRRRGQGRAALVQRLQAEKPSPVELHQHAGTKARRLSEVPRLLRRRRSRRNGGPEGSARGQDDRRAGGVRVRVRASQGCRRGGGPPQSCQRGVRPGGGKGDRFETLGRRREAGGAGAGKRKDLARASQLGPSNPGQSRRESRRRERGDLICARPVKGGEG